MKTIVIGDIHGCYNELKSLISTLETEGEYRRGIDKLIFLGDYIDRGDDSRLVIEFIRNLQENNDNVIALKGNHEDMLLEYMKGEDDSWLWNGYKSTMESYDGYGEQFKSDVQWMRNLPLYHEDEHFIYVHAGVDTYKPIEEQNEGTLLWIREPFIYSMNKYYKRIIFGHTPTLSLNRDYKPVRTYANNIGIDTGCVYGGALTALIIEDDKVDGFYQEYEEYEEEEYEEENI